MNNQTQHPLVIKQSTILKVLAKEFPAITFEFTKDGLYWVDGTNEQMVRDCLIKHKLFDHEEITLAREITGAYYKKALKRFWKNYNLPIEDLPQSFEEFCKQAPCYSWAYQFKENHGCWIGIKFTRYMGNSYQDINYLINNFTELMQQSGFKVPQLMLDILKQKLEQSNGLNINSAGELYNLVMKDYLNELKVIQIYFSGEQGKQMVIDKIKELL